MDRPPQLGTGPIPEGTSQLIMRLANSDAEGMHSGNRVENEVATISLASAALRPFQSQVIPQVYGWGTAKAGAQGWILEELMPGVPLDEAFETMGLQQKKKIFAQMAELLRALQECKLPDTITGSWGVTFSDARNIISASMPAVGAGPWPSYQASFGARLEAALEEADKNPYIKGWRVEGLRDRLDRFVARGVPAQFKELRSKDDRVIVHADFSKSLSCPGLPPLPGMRHFRHN